MEDEKERNLTQRGQWMVPGNEIKKITCLRTCCLSNVMDAA